MYPDLAAGLDLAAGPPLPVGRDLPAGPNLAVGPGLTVDADDLRSAAEAAAGTAERLSAGARQEPTVNPTPRWTTTDAAIMAAGAARASLTLLGADLAETARRIAVSAAAYEDADARAAIRLRLTR